MWSNWRTKEEVGRQHQGMDRPGLRQVPEGSGEQGKMEKTGCKIICGAPTTLAVKGLMMMMILELREILLSIQTGFNLVNAAVICAILKVLQDATNEGSKPEILSRTPLNLWL